MKCQIGECNKEATHCACSGKEVKGVFCRKHCFMLVDCNWAARIEKVPEVNGNRKIAEFCP